MNFISENFCGKSIGNVNLVMLHFETQNFSLPQSQIDEIVGAQTHSL